MRSHYTCESNLRYKILGAKYYTPACFITGSDADRMALCATEEVPVVFYELNA